MGNKGDDTFILIIKRASFQLRTYVCLKSRRTRIKYKYSDVIRALSSFLHTHTADACLCASARQRPLIIYTHTRVFFINDAQLLTPAEKVSEVLASTEILVTSQFLNFNFHG